MFNFSLRTKPGWNKMSYFQLTNCLSRYLPGMHLEDRTTNSFSFWIYCFLPSTCSFQKNKAKLTTIVILKSKTTGEQFVSKMPVQLSPWFVFVRLTVKKKLGELQITLTSHWKLQMKSQILLQANKALSLGTKLHQP